jgi:TRAP-type C4-dicarboxylate transport system permease large subunit
MNVFVISAMAKNVPMATIFKGVTPFFASEIARVVLILMFPGLVLWLPNLLGA